MFLIRLAFSNASSASRFRVVSEDTIGNSGGLVVTKNRKAFYSERFELGKNRLINSSIRFFAPSKRVIRPLKMSDREVLHASMHSDDKGIYVELPTQLLELVGWVGGGNQADLNSLAGVLLTASYIGPKKLLISSIGVGVEATDRGVRLTAKSPEALIRFSSYVVQSQSVRLIAGSRFQLSLQLPSTAVGLALQRDDVDRITDWSFHHVSWLD
jgi:hypothetical protein